MLIWPKFRFDNLCQSKVMEEKPLGVGPAPLVSAGLNVVTAVFKKVATNYIDFSSRDANRTHKSAFKFP